MRTDLMISVACRPGQTPHAIRSCALSGIFSGSIIHGPRSRCRCRKLRAETGRRSSSHSRRCVRRAPLRFVFCCKRRTQRGLRAHLSPDVKTCGCVRSSKRTNAIHAVLERRMGSSINLERGRRSLFWGDQLRDCQRNPRVVRRPCAAQRY